MNCFINFDNAKNTVDQFYQQKNLFLRMQQYELE